MIRLPTSFTSRATTPIRPSSRTARSDDEPMGEDRSGMSGVCGGCHAFASRSLTLQCPLQTSGLHQRFRFTALWEGKRVEVSESAYYSIPNHNYLRHVDHGRINLENLHVFAICEKAIDKVITSKIRNRLKIIPFSSKKNSLIIRKKSTCKI